LITIGNPSQLARGYYNRRSLDVVDAELVYAHVGFGAEAVDYRQAWETQRAVHGRRVLGEIPDCCLLLEHSPVYTAGKRTAVSDRPFGDPGAPVIDVDRGGKITWHGPVSSPRTRS
jgi:lipoyl(octanoyl) transferase